MASTFGSVQAYGRTIAAAPKPAKAPKGPSMGASLTGLQTGPTAAPRLTTPGSAALTGLQPVQPTPVKPAAVPSPGPAAPTSTPAAPPTQPSPYDSTYYIDLASATARANNQINNYSQDIANGQTGLGTALGQLTQNNGLSVTNAQNAENSRGGFALGHLGQTVGQINQNTLDAQSADTLRFQQDSQNWNNAIAAVRQGLSNEQIALGIAAATRSAKVNASSDGTIGPVAAPASAPTAAPATSRETAVKAAPKAAAAKLLPKPQKVARNQIGYHGGF